MSAIWLYKCNAWVTDDGEVMNDWGEVFGSKNETEWGGEWCTGNPVSQRIFREEIAAEDLVLCYQTNDREIVGICEATRFADNISGDKPGRTVYLKPVEKFAIPVKIHDLKKTSPTLQNVRTLQPALVRAIYELNDEEAQLLLSTCKSKFRK
jgi:EVE domain